MSRRSPSLWSERCVRTRSIDGPYTELCQKLAEEAWGK
jgi:hypothetical protein